MTVVTLAGFAPAETVNVYPFAIGSLWARGMGQTPPGVPVTTGAASSTGAYAPDLPDNIEYLALGLTSRVSKQVLNATTVVVDP